MHALVMMEVVVVMVDDEGYAQDRMKITLSEYCNGRGWGERVRVAS